MLPYDAVANGIELPQLICNLAQLTAGTPSTTGRCDPTLPIVGNSKRRVRHRGFTGRKCSRTKCLPDDRRWKNQQELKITRHEMKEKTAMIQVLQPGATKGTFGQTRRSVYSRRSV